MIAGTERTELAREGTGRAGELLGIGLHPHEHVMAGQPAPRDDLRHRTSPFSVICRRDNIAGPAKVPWGRGRDGADGRYRLLAAISVMSFFRMASPKVS